MHIILIVPKRFCTGLMIHRMPRCRLKFSSISLFSQLISDGWWLWTVFGSSARILKMDMMQGSEFTREIGAIWTYVLLLKCAWPSQDKGHNCDCCSVGWRTLGQGLAWKIAISMLEFIERVFIQSSTLLLQVVHAENALAHAYRELASQSKSRKWHYFPNRYSATLLQPPAVEGQQIDDRKESSGRAWKVVVATVAGGVAIGLTGGKIFSDSSPNNV